MNHRYLTHALCALSLGCSLSSSLPAAAQESCLLGLEQLITQAIQTDPWLTGSKLRQTSIQQEGQAANHLPDPVLSFGAMNLAAPINGDSLSQEPMTQLRVGLSQQFARGDSLAIKQAQLDKQAEEYPYLRQHRRAQLTSQVAQLWLELYLHHQTISLIQDEQRLLDELAQTTKSSYSHGGVNAQQQDVVRVDLALIQLQDRLVAAEQQREMAFANLSRWVPDVNNGLDCRVAGFDLQELTQILPKDLDQVLTHRGSAAHFYDLITQHPSVRAVDTRYESAQQGVRYAKEQLKPQWGMNASYGYRRDSIDGSSRADLVSVGVTLDMPLFSREKQDSKVAASVANAQAIQTDKRLAMQKLLSELEREIRTFQRLQERHHIYQQSLMEQLALQVETQMSAYIHQQGSLSDVVRARIELLNANISLLQISVQSMQTQARTNYYLTQADTTQSELSIQSGVQP